MQTLSGDGLVSMNIWGFQRVFFEQLQGRFRAFLEEAGTSETAECYLPSVVQDLVQAGQARVKVLPTMDTWVGVTHAEDKPRVVAMIASLVERGDYPRALWD